MLFLCCIFPLATILCIQHAYSLGENMSWQQHFLAAFQHYQQKGTFDGVLMFFQEHLEASVKADDLFVLIHANKCMCFIVGCNYATHSSESLSFRNHNYHLLLFFSLVCYYYSTTACEFFLVLNLDGIYMIHMLPFSENYWGKLPAIKKLRTFCLHNI